MGGGDSLFESYARTRLRDRVFDAGRGLSFGVGVADRFEGWYVAVDAGEGAPRASRIADRTEERVVFRVGVDFLRVDFFGIIANSVGRMSHLKCMRMLGSRCSCV